MIYSQLVRVPWSIASIFLFILISCRAIAADFPRAFHVAGIPDTKPGKRVDIILDADELVIAAGGHAGSYRVPYSRIQQILLLPSVRNYEKTTAAAAAASGVAGIPAGALLILVKHKMATIVIDYVNERGGRMGMVLQVERSEEQDIRSRFEHHGLIVADSAEHPGSAASSEATSQQKGNK